MTTIALFAAVMVVGGYVMYTLSNLVPIPGSKFVFMGPYLTCVMMIPLIRYPRFGTLSLINLVFGGLMFIFSPWMTLAIVVSGILADCGMLLPVKLKVKQLWAMGIYNGMSMLTSFCVTNYITGNGLFRILNFQVLLVAFVLSIIAGSLGGYAGQVIHRKYLGSRW